MSGFLKKIFLFFLLVSGLLLTGAGAILLFCRPVSTFDYDGGLTIKQALIRKNRDSSKIVLIGGSNLAIGFCSEVLRDSFPGYAVINYGHRFHFGLSFYLREIKPFLRKGDMVVLIPEYQLMLKDYFGNNGLNPVFFEGLHTAPLALAEILDMKVNTLRYLEYRFKSHFRVKAASDIRDHNRKDGFNAFGDLIIHRNMKPLRPLPVFEGPQDFAFDQRQVRDLRAFIAYCQSNGISIVNIPPAMAAGTFRVLPRLIQENKRVFTEVGLPFSVSPEAMVMPDSLFFDSPYHLLKTGATTKAQKVAEILQSRMGITHLSTGLKGKN